MILFCNIKTFKKRVLECRTCFGAKFHSSRNVIDVIAFLLAFYQSISNSFQKLINYNKQIYKQIKSTFWCKYCENINVFSREFKNVLMENSIIMFKASNGVGLNKLLNKKIYKC